MTQPIKVREAVGLFDDYDHLQETIKELEESGFNRRQISVLGTELAREQRFGASRVNPVDMEDDPNTPRSANIAAEELSIAQGVVMGIGMLTGGIFGLFVSRDYPVIAAEALAFFATIAGGAIGSLLAEVLGEQYLRFFKRQADEGGLLLWVQTPDRDHEIKARDVLLKHGAHDVHVHEIALAA